MINFFKSRPLLIIIVIILMFVLLMFLTSGNRYVSLPESVVGAAVTPVASVFSRAVNGVSDFFSELFNTTDLDVQNAELRARISQLESDALLINEIKSENERLRAVADYIEANDEMNIITAKVVAKSPGFWFDMFLINAGRSRGVEVDMPVITPYGLVGRVIEVGANWSKVLGIIDTRSSVSGLVERTRDTGIVRGALQLENDDGLCQIFYLPNENDIKPGDRVLTSGLGGIYPKGLLIGEVIEVGRQRDQVQRSATIKPSVDFRHIEEVMVIMGSEELSVE